MAPSLKQRKIAVVGGRAVGKSSLTIRFLEGNFADTYYPTIENTYHQIISHKGQDYATDIVDTAGQDAYSVFDAMHFIGIHGYMIVYSVASRESFDLIRVLRDKILNHLGADWVPLVLVGNKSDLPAEMHQVTAEEVKNLADEFQSAWIEASARDGQNVSEAFGLMIGEIEKAMNPQKPNAYKCSVM